MPIDGELSIPRGLTGGNKWEKFIQYSRPS